MLYLSFCCFASALGGLLFGYDLFVISGAKDLIVQHFKLSTLMEGWFVSSAMVGAMLGCIAAGTVSDRFGRKKVLVVASIFLLACSVGCGLAWSTGSLIFFRWIGGVGVGIASMVCPLYISEISPPRLRGRMVTLFQLAICVGIVAAILVNTGLLSWHDKIKGTEPAGWVGSMVAREVWRSMLGMETLPALLFFVTCLIIAESPRWLAEKGREREALQVLERINGPEIAATELADITSTVADESGSLMELLKPGLRRALFMALFLAVVSEFSGITTIWNFGPEIIRGQGIQLTNEMTGMVVIASSLSIFTLVAVWLMDHAGRRRLLFWGNLGCFLSLLVLGALLGRPDSSSALKVAAAATFVACFAFSMGPIKWVFHVGGLPHPHSRAGGGHQFPGRLDRRCHPEPTVSHSARHLGQTRHLLCLRAGPHSAILFRLEDHARNQGAQSGGHRAVMARPEIRHWPGAANSRQASPSER